MRTMRTRGTTSRGDQLQPTPSTEPNNSRTNGNPEPSPLSIPSSSLPRSMSEESFRRAEQMERRRGENTEGVYGENEQSTVMQTAVGQQVPFVIRNCTVVIDSIYNYGQDYHGVGCQQIRSELDHIIGELQHCFQ